MNEEHCIFCKIVRSDIPSEKVFENEDFLAFMDINPESPGHIQVIPKEHYRYVWDVPNIEEYFSIVRDLAKAMQGLFNTEYVFSKIMGDEVHHAHVWLFPNPHEARGDKTDFKNNADKIKNAL